MKFWKDDDPSLFQCIECEHCDIWFLKFSMDGSHEVSVIRTGTVHFIIRSEILICDSNKMFVDTQSWK